MNIDEDEEDGYDVDFEVRRIIAENPIIQQTFDEAKETLSAGLDMINLKLSEKTNGRVLCYSYSMRVTLDNGAKIQTLIKQ